MSSPAPRYLMAKPSVVFVCVANSCRSQIAEAAARMAVGDQWEIWSAGSRPGGRVHPLAIQLMDERGYDLRAHHSKGIDALPSRQWDIVVTMGCGDACPMLRAATRVEWDIPDPVGLPVDEARRIRDELIRRVRLLLINPSASTVHGRQSIDHCS